MTRTATFQSPLPVRAKLQASLHANRKRTKGRRYYTAPRALGWTGNAITPTFTKTEGTYKSPVNPRTLVDPAIWTGEAFYVAASSGNSGNDGSDFENAFSTIHAAITAGNATNAPFCIYVDADEELNESSFSSNGNVAPTENFALVGVSGAQERAVYVSGPPVADVTWTLDSGTMYTTAESATKRVLNMSELDAYGLPTDLTEVADSATCAVTNDSYAVDGSTVYVNIGEDPDGKLRVLRNFNTAGNWNAEVDIYMENFEIWGGGTGCFSLDSNVDRNVIGQNVRFMAPASANKGSSPKDAMTIQNSGGLVAFFNSEASMGHKDGWNFHHNTDTNPMFVLLLSCVGYRNGADSDGSSNNFTTHDDIVAIAVGCTFSEAYYGTDVHCIQETRTWLADCAVVSRDGDGSSTCYQCSADAFMWIEDSSADAQDGGSTNYAIEANGGTVKTRNFAVIAGDIYAYNGGSIGAF